MPAHSKSTPSLLPLFPSVPKSVLIRVKEPQIPQPLRGCARLCKPLQGYPEGGAANL